MTESPLLKELKIMKIEIRRLRELGDFLRMRVSDLADKIEEEATLIREQNIELKNEIINEIKDARS